MKLSLEAYNLVGYPECRLSSQGMSPYYKWILQSDTKMNCNLVANQEEHIQHKAWTNQHML